ncbi:zinc finger, TAZ-type containing protein [Tanacetum coccineum]
MFSGTKANIIITEGATGSNEQISKGSERNGDNTTKDEFNKPPEFHFQDNTTSDGREESSQVGPVVNCGINTNSDGYESIMEPMERMKTHQNASSVDCDEVLAFENTKTQTTSFNDNETGPGSGHINIQSVFSVDCDMVYESESIEAQTACFDDNGSGPGSGNMKIPSVSSVDCEMVSESEITEAQTACFNDNSSGGSKSENMKIPSVSLVDCDMVSESEKTKAQVACLDDNSSVSGSENMKIPSVSSADCDMVSESKKTKVQVACSEDKSSGGWHVTYVKSGNTIFVVSKIRKEIKEKENIFALSVACSEEKSSCTLSSQFTLFTIILFELINAGTVIAALIYMFANHAMRLKVDALLDALVHAFGCKNKNIECTYPCCQNIKKLLLHDSTCRIPRCM